MLTNPAGGEETVIPDPADYPDPLTHKLALAAGGCYLLPIDPATKHPGSYAHEGWPLKSSRDERLIRQWHGVDQGHATVIHTGSSGLVVIDLDLDGDEIPTGSAGAVRDCSRPPGLCCSTPVSIASAATTCSPPAA